MGKIINECLSCESKQLSIGKIECNRCHAKYEGKFDFPSVFKLSPEDSTFILDFVKCSGSLKEMAKKQNVSYPTMRNRLNDLIEKLENMEDSSTLQKDDILAQLEAGKISAKEAAELLSKL